MEGLVFTAIEEHAVLYYNAPDRRMQAIQNP
jgi:hypothetical protein